MGVLLKLASGLLRRLLGGWLSTKEIISERGVQWLIGVLIYGPTIYWMDNYNTWLRDWLPLWLFALLGAISLVLCLTTGHFPGFMCGTESQEYIDEQIKNGRDIPFQKLVDWIGSKRGFEPFSRNWCAWQLFFCKTTACILPAFFFGYHFIAVGFLVTMTYNAMFWINPKPIGKILTSPTNYGEFVQGWFIMGALI